MSGAHADPQLKESYSLLVMKVHACVRVCMEVWCVHEGMVCAWRCGVSMEVCAYVCIHICTHSHMHVVHTHSVHVHVVFIM